MDEDEAYDLEPFDTLEAAEQAARAMVERNLQHLLRPPMTAEKMIEQWYLAAVDRSTAPRRSWPSFGRYEVLLGQGTAVADAVWSKCAGALSPADEHRPAVAPAGLSLAPARGAARLG